MTELLIGIIDADLIGRRKHRFPNLACMKISSYQKQIANKVDLVTDYTDIDRYDKLYLSKVFTDTSIPHEVLDLPNLEYGGTGFFYDKAPRLPDEVEHSMPDYHLYDHWVEDKLRAGGKHKDFTYYLDYSIGFLTRGCFRQCQFCVNQNYKHVEIHSPLHEFTDPDRPKICLLDDNFFGCSQWKELFLELQKTGKSFQFKQGLDERLLTDEKCKILFNSKYDRDYIFAFDNIAEYDLIEQKLQLIRKYTNKNVKFYVLCGFDRVSKYDLSFWCQDIIDLFSRIRLLAKYRCLPYVMRFEKYKNSPFRGVYVNIASWCNQPAFFKKLSYREWCENDDRRKGRNSATKRYNEYLLSIRPDLHYLFDTKFGLG